ncbi:MAG: hypothetical protein ABEJ08_05130 [Halobacteriaceae archaeon]
MPPDRPTWGGLFDRTGDAWTVEDVRAALADRRAADRDQSTDESGRGADSGRTAAASTEAESRPDPDPAAVVADADVLAADLLVGGDARAALDCVRRHSWVRLPASDALLADAAATVEAMAGPDLAADWRTRATAATEPVDHPAGDHPGLASALRSGAAHVLTFDRDLTDAAAGTALRAHGDVSVREPAAFVTVFDPAAVYPAAVGGEYHGPDRDPRD